MFYVTIDHVYKCKILTKVNNDETSIDELN